MIATINSQTGKKPKREPKHTRRNTKKLPKEMEAKVSLAGELTTVGYLALAKASASRNLKDAEIEAVCLFEIDAAHSLLEGTGVRSVHTSPYIDSAPVVYQLADVHAAWKAASTERQPNVAVVRDNWKTFAIEDCCSFCQCDRFLEQVLDAINIEHQAGLIVLHS